MIEMSKLYSWRSALFHAYAGNGAFESMVFCLHPTYTPDEEILNYIIKRGGFVTSKPSFDFYTVNLVNTKAENYTANTQFKAKYDLFDSTFIERCVEQKQLVDLNLYRIGESSFEEYDANEVLTRKLRWNEIKKKQVSDPVAITSTTNSSLHPVLPKSSENSKPLSIKPNEIAVVSKVSKNISATRKGNITPSKSKNVIESSSSSESEHSSNNNESSQKNLTSPKSSLQPGSSQKKKRWLENYLSDTSSSGTSDTTKIAPERRKSHPRKRLSKKNLEPSSETLKLKSLSQNSDGHNSTTITKVIDEINALVKADLYPKKKEKVLKGPITRNKSKTFSVSPRKSLPSLNKRATSNGAAATSFVASTSTNNVETESVLNNTIDSPPKSQIDENKKCSVILSKLSLSEIRTPSKSQRDKKKKSNVSISQISLSKSKSPPKVSTQKSIISNDVENDDSSSSTGSSTTTVQSPVPSTSKASKSVSKPTASSSQGSSKSAKEKSLNNKHQRQTEDVSKKPKETTPANFRPPACSSPKPHSSAWLSALQDMNEANRMQPELEEEPEVRPKRRHVTYLEDDRPARCISPVESVFEDDFQDRTGSSYASTTTHKRSYTQQEKDAILQFVCENDYHQYTRGNIIWRKLQDTKLVPDRTWQSLREHFIKQMLPQLDRNRKLKAQDKKKFQRAMKVVKLKQKRPAPV